MTDLCKMCKRKPNCPPVCYPKRDWERGKRKGKGRKPQYEH